MSSTKEYRDYILEQLNNMSNITCKPMMILLKEMFLIYPEERLKK